MKQETMPARENGTARRNKYFFGLGTIGRDMFYSMVSMFLLTYITEVLTVSDAMLLKIGFVLTVLRVFDALNDPIMGTLVDNTNTRWGKFKPLILGGAVTGAVFMVLLFTDLHLSDTWYIVLFAVFYLAWDVFYGANDIAYWSMMPALSLDQKERERIGAFARICANVGMFAVVVGILPVTGAMTEAMGSGTKAWFFFAVIVALLMLGFQCFTLFGVKEHRSMFKQEEKTTLKDTIRVIFKNDQLLFTTVAMALFMIGYSTTTSFGTYYFIYAYGDAGMYSVFAAVLGVSQLSALTVFPKFSARFTRKQLYFGATVLVVLGYLIFFFAPMNMIFIGAGRRSDFCGPGVHPAPHAHVPCGYHRIRPVENRKTKRKRHIFHPAAHQQNRRGNRKRHCLRYACDFGHQRGAVCGGRHAGRPADPEAFHACAAASLHPCGVSRLPQQVSDRCATAPKDP